ncbi:MAG: F0F1 ATP synthase subunit A [Bdellovibrionales bacterium]
MSFNWTQLIPAVGPENVHVATLGLATAGSVVVGLIARAQLGKGQDSVVPHGRLSVRGLIEAITDMIATLAKQIIGPDGHHYVPLMASFFFFILLNNLIGVIPGMSSANENLNTTVAFGIFSFLAYNYVGLKHGGLHYLKHFLGPVWWLIPLMLPLEIISHLIRPMTLGMRLANVMKGDHTVIGIVLDIVPFIVPIALYILGLLVCLIQAYVFTLLSMVYVSLAKASDH